ncbi:MAG: CAP domain-containing protein [Acidobacteriota bacterium]
MNWERVPAGGTGIRCRPLPLIAMLWQGLATQAPLAGLAYLSAPARLLIAESDDAVASDLLDRVNRERKSVGLPALCDDGEIRETARRHSAEMMAAGRIYHDSPITGSSEDRLRDVSLFFWKSGENVARGPEAAMIHIGLMESPPHRENILDPGFTHVGIGVVSNGSDLYVTQLFLRVLPKAGPAELVDAALTKLQKIRGERRLLPLRKDMALVREAERLVEQMYQHDSQQPESLSPGLSNRSVRIIGCVGESPPWETVGEAAGFRWNSVGIGAIQGRSKTWPHGANWYVILLGD